MTNSEVVIKPSLGSDVKSKKIFLTPNLRPSDNHVIAYGERGQAVSRYGDSVWDFTEYLQSTGYCKINFESCRNADSINFDKNMNEIKWLLFIYINQSNNGRGGITSALSLSAFWKLSMKNLLIYSTTKDISVKSILESSDLFREYVFSTNITTTLPGLSTCINMLMNLGAEVTGYQVFGGKTLDDLNVFINRYHETRQTPVIPERILSHCIAENHKFIEEFLENRVNLIKLMESAKLNGYLYGLSKCSQTISGVKKKDHFPYFKEVVTDHDLTDLFHNHSVTTMKQISRYLKSVQAASKTLIHVYSGMRDGEVLSLGYDCLTKEIIENREILRLVGNTFKLETTFKATSWVTSKDVIHAVESAQSVNKMVSMFKTHGDDRLFIRTSGLFVEEDRFKKTKKYYSFMIQKKHKIENIEITEHDLLELERYSPARDWRSDEKYQLGNNWSFSAHQFRRSLAFYAAQSGLVSLPTLKQQLQHITKEMSVYYAAGASVMTTLFSSDSSHISTEYQEVKPEADATAWIYKVIASKERLYGPLGKILEKQKCSNITVNIIDDIDEARKRFKRGEIALKETPSGFCTSVETCDKRVMRSVFACVSCDKAIIKEEKIQVVMDAYVETLSRLDSSSVEYLMELEASNDVKKLLNEIKSC